MADGLHVLVQYCRAASAARQAEYDACLARNLDNPWVTAVHNLAETGVPVPEDLARHPKYVGGPAGPWLTFARAFAYAGDHLSGALVCLCNLDIFLDAGSRWDQADRMVGDGRVVLCLARHEFDGHKSWRDPALAGIAFASSQDAWLFRPPLTVPDGAFEVGVLGCDNAIAERLRRAGRIPVNAGGRFVIHHYDAARGKSGANTLAVHGAEAPRPGGHPEERGQYLVPDLDMTDRFAGLVDRPAADPLDRYRQICDAVTARLAVDNRR